MSMENAILEHAAALRELSAAIKAMYAGRADALGLPADQGGIIAGQVEQVAALPADAPRTVEGKAAKGPELENVVAKVEADAKNDAATAPRPADAAAPNASAPVAPSDTGDAEAAPLDYAKDVKPLLLAAIKKGKRADIEAHLAEHGVKRADELPVEKLPELFALAQKLAA